MGGKASDLIMEINMPKLHLAYEASHRRGFGVNFLKPLNLYGGRNLHTRVLSLLASTKRQPPLLGSNPRPWAQQCNALATAPPRLVGKVKVKRETVQTRLPEKMGVKA